MADELTRVFLWGIPRTLSTVLVKCLSYIEGMQIVNQPYVCAAYFGPDSELLQPGLQPDAEDPMIVQIKRDIAAIKKQAADWKSGLDESLFTFEWVRDKLLGAAYQDKKYILCKEQAVYLEGKYKMLPKGFRYSFVIRHPAKLFLSYKKYLMTLHGDITDMRAMHPKLFPVGCGFKELYDLVEYVRENLDPDPVILDADDLLENPAGILSAYCHKVGLPYSDRLLSWAAGDGISTGWLMARVMTPSMDKYNFYQAAFESVGFHKPYPAPDLESLPDDVQSCVRFSMVYYEELHRQRIRPISDNNVYKQQNTP